MDFLIKNAQQGNKRNNRDKSIQTRTQNPELFGDNREFMKHNPKIKIKFEPK